VTRKGGECHQNETNSRIFRGKVTNLIVNNKIFITYKQLWNIVKPNIDLNVAFLPWDALSGHVRLSWRVEPERRRKRWRRPCPACLALAGVGQHRGKDTRPPSPNLALLPLALPAGRAGIESPSRRGGGGAGAGRGEKWIAGRQRIEGRTPSGCVTRRCRRRPSPT